MTTTLSEGVKVPDVGSVNWAGDLEVNWNLLNGALANLSGNVKLDRDNTWTGEQSFTLPIVGSITGTAAKAIADEDGTSIKTGYVNVAGNQTVSGQKTWSSNQFYTAGAYHRNNSYEIGNTPASNVAIPIYFTDKVNVHTGYVRNAILTTGRTQSELYARNKFTNGALSPTGTDVSSTLQVEVQSNGDKTLYFDGSIRNNVLPYTTNTYSLGSSSYQWSSVYAQSYYYNGTEFSSKFVTTDTAQTINADKEFNATKFLRVCGYRFQITSALAAGTIPASNQWTGFQFTGANGSLVAEIVMSYQSSGNTFFQINVVPNEANAVKSAIFDYVYNPTNNVNYIRTSAKAFVSSTTSVADLGTSTNKWKTLNGVNPGALSLPSSSYVDISGDITVRDGSASNSLTASCDGWIALCTFATWLQMSNDTLVMAVTGAIGADGFSQAFLPVRKGDSIRIIVNQTNTLFQSFRLIPCLGNV